MVTAVNDHSALPSCPPGLPSAAQILGRAGGENFTVASRLLPARARAHLLAFYGYARLVDYLGDDYAGDRLAALDWADAVLTVSLNDLSLNDLSLNDMSPNKSAAAGTGPARNTTARTGPARNTTATSRRTGPAGALDGHGRLDEGPLGLIAAAARSAVAVGAGPAPLRLLIEANRTDQTRSSYDTWDDLVGYCRLSANPVGHLVLAAFDASTPARRLLSDDICTALQVAEHLQDVAEDALAGRTYLPGEDLGRFGVRPGDLVELARSGGPAPAPVRALIAFEAWRARRLLERGSALLGLVDLPDATLDLPDATLNLPDATLNLPDATPAPPQDAPLRETPQQESPQAAPLQAAPLRGAARLAVAGFVAGGHGALDAVAAAGYDPFAGTPRPSPRRVAAHFARLLRGRAWLTHKAAGGPA